MGIEIENKNEIENENIMLVNAKYPSEVRIAIVNKDNIVEQFECDNITKNVKVGDIYLARIKTINESLEAVFVEYDNGKQGFLPFKEIDHSYFIHKKTDSKLTPNISSILREGQELLIQIVKEDRGKKNAALTTYISLAGRYLVIMPNNPRATGISRHIDGNERQELKNVIDKLSIPKNIGVILRTASIGCSKDEIEKDLRILLKLWEAIKIAAASCNSPCLIHQENNIVIRSIRDYFTKHKIGKIYIDNKEVFEYTKKYLTLIKHEGNILVHNYDNQIPIFLKFGISKQISKIYHREVSLPSGGSIVIDTTEALTVIDVNSYKATKYDNLEKTAFQTNNEAAKEIARQLRMRDLGGLIVIDFIDMREVQKRTIIENTLSEELKLDRARIQMLGISKFGILELSRQRINPSLHENNYNLCNKCQGRGYIPNINHVSISILREIEEKIFSENLSDKIIKCLLPNEILTFMINEKREMVIGLDQLTNGKIFFIPDPNLHAPSYELEIIDQKRVIDSHQLINKKKVSVSANITHNESLKPIINASELHLNNGKKDKNNIFKKIFSFFSTDAEDKIKDNDKMPKKNNHRNLSNKIEKNNYKKQDNLRKNKRNNTKNYTKKQHKDNIEENSSNSNKTLNRKNKKNENIVKNQDIVGEKITKPQVENKSLHKKANKINQSRIAASVKKDSDHSGINLDLKSFANIYCDNNVKKIITNISTEQDK